MSESRLSLLRQKGGFFSLEGRDVVRIGGPDRERYLNGQTSNDIRRLTPDLALPSLVLSAKGKLTAVVLLWIEGGELVAEPLGGDAEILLARLERYAIADDVTFELASPGGWHVFGAAAEGMAGRTVSRIGAPGRDVDELPTGLVEATGAEREILRLERGIPKWGRELGEDTLPQEAGLEKFAVNFQKGCYVGQEVVSRIQSVGRVNRELVGLVGDFDPARAAVLQTADGTKAGTLTSAIFHPEIGRAAALGFVSTRVAGTTFVVVDETGACLGGAERSQFPLVS